MFSRTMKLSLIALSFLVTSAWAGITIKEFEDEFHELWSDPSDEKAAAEQLAKAEASIEQDNLEYQAGKSSFSEKLNALSALPEDEFEDEKLGALEAEQFAMGLIETPEEHRILSLKDEAYLNQTYAELDRTDIPTSYMLGKGLVTPAKNQESCGSCAAFAATAVHESCLLLSGVPSTGMDLSEQQLLDCGYNGNSMNGCKGAWVGAYQDWLANNGGTTSHEAQYPYLDRNPNLQCMTQKPKWQSGGIVKNALIDYGCDESKLKQLVFKYGAVATGIYASDGALSNAQDGVFDQCTSSKINHAVTVVGYGTQDGTDYWLVKNSWGESWGDNGYIKIKRGVGMCGIGGNCATTECKWVGNGTPAPIAPPPPPIPPSQICDISGVYNRKDITGTYTLTTNMNGVKYIADVVCEKSMCRPKIAGPSNACKYICGQLTC